MLSNVKIAFVFIFAVLLVFLFNSIFVVQEAEQAIVMQLGRVVRDIKKSGLYFKLPFINNVEFFDKRVLDLSPDTTAREVITADQKRIIVDAYAKYKIVDPVTFYQTVKNELGLIRRLYPIIEAHLRENIVRFSLISLLNEKRSEVMQLIQRGVYSEAGKFGIEIIDVRIKRADLPEENSSAIFRRMQTEREKEAKEIRAKGEQIGQEIRSKADKQKREIIASAVKEAYEIRGRGYAEATRIYNEVFKADEEFFNFYRSMNAYSKSFTGNNTKFVLSPNNSFLDILNKGWK
ncbi:membrane protease subunit stomatinprohibitin-like protein [Wolbachia endosymbiont of Onchocerca ochengi]|uniref:protease modulator HflC n=1 Tax=Wolbachia endosymbiont of Onchocerca ochengi TaxID=100901 RepID=UPI0000DB93B5|nr:protease modulator HflC [Wolbachia endosymbiont of Onchocerca ochengi]CAL29443.1 Protease subunit, hflC [Wolbachia endosymbiont of Onchocerca volvulus]CCF78243.1 membrane protease subunit stomatinprohibitin-like protein [Wolbachia endosymbiont of Onchocerca ochengi]